ncbi:MAG: DUF4258 domain-containing protein [Deltaproteobacteria bacterium]|nr:DUF4258 domain-containing protein [Deltaproteobacteria bacterium]
MNAAVVRRVSQEKGVLFTFSKKGQEVDILFLNHAIERMEKWGLTLEMVSETLLEPEEVLRGHHSRFIAHKRYREYILRAVYEYEGSLPSLVTVYFPYKHRYYEGGERIEDKILK